MSISWSPRHQPWLHTGPISSWPRITGSAAAQAAQDKQNFGSHLSHCARAVGGFSGGHNPSMMHGTPWAEHTCQM